MAQLISKISTPALVLGGEAIPMTVADATPQHVAVPPAAVAPPHLAALPVRSQKVAIVVLAPNFLHEPSQRLSSTRVAVLRLFGAAAVAELCLGVHETAAHHELLGLEGPAVPVVVGFVVSTQKIRTYPDNMQRCVAPELGDDAVLRILRVGTADTHSVHYAALYVKLI